VTDWIDHINSLFLEILGRDASRSFHTGGTTSEDLTDDLTGLSDEAIAAVHHWLTFYQKTYPQIGSRKANLWLFHWKRIW